jgi:transcription initiation factor TFIIE subunit alpha
MKLSNDLIHNVVLQVAGEDVIPLVKALKNKKNISEFKLAENIGQEINITRNMLYRLYHANLVSFTRRKDKQKGWYIYYWTFKTKMIKFLLTDLKKKKIEALTERITREKANFFFMCSTQCMRLNFDQAVDFNYKCPECGIIMNQVDNQEKIVELEKELAALKKGARKKSTPQTVKAKPVSKPVKVSKAKTTKAKTVKKKTTKKKK